MTKLQSAQVYVLSYPEPNDYSEKRHALIVRLETTEGIVGWGEGIAQWLEACQSSAVLTKNGFIPLLENEDLMEHERIWQKIHQHAWWYGRTGIGCLALSAIDIALWDIKGKVLNQPLYKLLGGRLIDKLPAIAAIHVNQPTVEDTIKDLQKYAENGFQGTKLGFGKKGLSKVGKDPNYDVYFIQRLREALGEDFAIMVDVGNGVVWDIQTAIRTTRRMSEYNIGWIEEPLHPENIQGHKLLRSSVDIPIATGEREWSVEGYKRLLDEDIVDIVGIDPGRVGGITSYKKIMDLVHAYKHRVNAHAWSTAITSAASLHASIASPNTLVFELKPIEGPAQFDMVETPIWHKDGFLYPIDEPGLGIQVKQSFIEKYGTKI